MFTADNTEGYSAADLATLNGALKRLVPGSAEADDQWTAEQMEKSASDAISNVWQPGMGEDELVETVRGTYPAFAA